MEEKKGVGRPRKEFFKKVGRPRKNEIRNVQISFSLTKEEADIFYLIVRNSGKSIANFMNDIVKKVSNNETQS